MSGILVIFIIFFFFYPLLFILPAVWEMVLLPCDVPLAKGIQHLSHTNPSSLLSFPAVFP